MTGPLRPDAVDTSRRWQMRVDLVSGGVLAFHPMEEINFSLLAKDLSWKLALNPNKLCLPLNLTQSPSFPIVLSSDDSCRAEPASDSRLLCPPYPMQLYVTSPGLTLPPDLPWLPTAFGPSCLGIDSWPDSFQEKPEAEVVPPTWLYKKWFWSRPSFILKEMEQPPSFFWPCPELKTVHLMAQGLIQ